MLSVEDRLQRLEERNAALEVQNRWMKRAGLAAVVLGGAALLAGQAGAQGKDAVKALRVSALEIVDGAGKVRLELGVDKDGAGIDILDANGKSRVVIGEGTIEDLGEGAGLWVFDDKERPRVGVGTGKHGAGLVVLDEKGKPVAADGDKQ